MSEMKQLIKLMEGLSENVPTTLDSMDRTSAGYYPRATGELLARATMLLFALENMKKSAMEIHDGEINLKTNHWWRSVEEKVDGLQQVIDKLESTE
jgi:hypothetical protein